jgi:SMODS-associating 2TM, beta-strand rich effector domain
MRPYRYNVRMFLLVSCTIAIAVYALSNLFPWTRDFGLILTPTAIAGGVGSFWWLFDRYLWRWPISRKLGISDLPDLNGRWLGTIDRVGENNQHSIVYTIHQTYTAISIGAESRNATSDTIAAQFLTNEVQSQFQILNYWICSTKKLDGPALEDFHGCSRITISTEAGSLVMRDRYFTNRNPATEGTVVLTREELVS